MGKTRKSIARRIKLERKKKGMTQIQLAEAVGYKGASRISAISRIEKLVVGVPVGKIPMLAKVLEISPEELVEM